MNSAMPILVQPLPARDWGLKRGATFWEAVFQGRDAPHLDGFETSLSTRDVLLASWILCTSPDAHPPKALQLLQAICCVH